jgi:general L-amino acid transport system permease protein
MAASRLPPRRDAGPAAWLRRNLFSSPFNSLLTVVTGVVLAWAIVGLVQWVFFDASWGRVWVNLKLFAVGLYPFDLVWRPLLALALLMALLGASAGSARDAGAIIRGVFVNMLLLVAIITAVALVAWPSVRWWWSAVLVAAVVGYLAGSSLPRLRRVLAWSWALSFPVALLLLYGYPPGGGVLRVVQGREWGGFMLTLILTTGLIPSFPIGIALALGRRSNLPAIKYFCIVVIEVIRGAPLIMWLFIASLLLPLLLNTDPNSLPAVLRAYVAITLFSSAYMAENVRGGLQSVPMGQSEAARALGLSGWQTMRLIVLPQALRAVIPAIVGQAIGLFKDTSLVFIVGLIDFFNVANIVANQPESLRVPGGIRMELSLFLAVIYWFFAYRMSIASRQLERELGVGER